MAEVTIVEVAPRDGLQNHDRAIETAQKIAFIEALVNAGARVIEAASFVSPAAAPMMVDAAEVMKGINRKPGVRYLALVPNSRGLERALEAGVDSIALFAAATEEFSQANLNASIADAFGRFESVMERARTLGLWVRGYVSVAFHCPFSGHVDTGQALKVIELIRGLGCDEIALADTTGMAEPHQVTSLVLAALELMPASRLALHFHDTHGRAIDNIQAGYDLGVRVFDSSAGGIGGCPFSPGAPGNVATELVVDHFEDSGVRTGIDADLIRAAYRRHVLDADPGADR
ncbi:hydroxymethylglutaryl-CoA lyase [soil metagenome]